MKEPYKCPHCDHTTTRNGNLKEHISKVHKIDSSFFKPLESDTKPSNMALPYNLPQSPPPAQPASKLPKNPFESAGTYVKYAVEYIKDVNMLFTQLSSLRMSRMPASFIPPTIQLTATLTQAHKMLGDGKNPPNVFLAKVIVCTVCGALKIRDFDPSGEHSPNTVSISELCQCGYELTLTRDNGENSKLISIEDYKVFAEGIVRWAGGPPLLFAIDSAMPSTGFIDYNILNLGSLPADSVFNRAANAGAMLLKPEELLSFLSTVGATYCLCEFESEGKRCCRFMYLCKWPTGTISDSRGGIFAQILTEGPEIADVEPAAVSGAPDNATQSPLRENEQHYRNSGLADHEPI